MEPLEPRHQIVLPGAVQLPMSLLWTLAFRGSGHRRRQYVVGCPVDTKREHSVVQPKVTGRATFDYS
jgi:hypothetical protein